MRLEEADLVLSVDRRSVCVVVHDATVKLACMVSELGEQGLACGEQLLTYMQVPMKLPAPNLIAIGRVLKYIT